MRIILQNRGFGILEGILSTALTSLLVFFISMQLHLYNTSTMALSQANQIEDTRNFVRTKLSCSNTLTSAVQLKCAGSGSYIPLRDSQTDSVFVPEYQDSLPAKYIGEQIALKAKCTEDPAGSFYKLKIEFAKAKIGYAGPFGDMPFAKNPLTKQNYQWTELFGGVPITCPRTVASLPPPPPPSAWTPNVCVFASAMTAYPKCPANMGVFTSSNGNRLSLVCCPLPASDILTGAIVLRNDSCSTNELVVGSQTSDISAAQLYCQKINTTKYKLSFKKQSCVWSNGGTNGWGGAGQCGSTPLVIGGIKPSEPTIIANVGTDGCSGNPFGSLMVERSSKYCSSQYYTQLLDLSGKPIPMPLPK